jgi:serine/threonine protein kinase
MNNRIHINRVVDKSECKINDIISNDGNDYEIIKKLGKGAFSNVFEVKSNIGRKVAIKIICKSLLFNNSRGISDRKIKAIENEINIHSQLKHDKIINFEKMFQDDINIYILLELSTESLNDVVKRKEYISENDAIIIILRIVDGLMYLKENLIVHLDIKLDNILINKDGNLKIADFGLAEKLTHKDDILYKFSGTPNYMSYEIVKSIPYSFEVDVWSLGVVFYILLFSKAPFERRDLKETYNAIETYSPEYPENFNIIIKNVLIGMLTKNRLDRISLEDIVNQLENI